MEQTVSVDSPGFHLTSAAAIERLQIDGVAGITDRIVEADCLEVLPELPGGCVDLIHTSPPYNIDKEYKHVEDDRELADYRAFLRQFIEEAFRVLKPNGSLFFQTGYSEDGGSQREIFPIDMLTYDDFKEAGFCLWDRIIWQYFGGMSFRRKFKNQHETILWWVRPGDDELSPYFDVDAVREASKSYDKRNNLWGKNPGNIWTEDRVAFGANRRSTSHIAIYPESITERIIRSCSREGELVLDPFAGSGTTPAVARSLGRSWIGIEVSPAYAEEAGERVGTRQPSEWRSLCSGLIKYLCFENEPKKIGLEVGAELFAHWLSSVRIKRYQEFYDDQIARVFEGGDTSRQQNKEPKPDVWRTFDEFLSGADRTHPILVASDVLDALFRQRRNWNSVRKYRQTVDLLGRVITAGEELSIPDLISQTAGHEPTSFVLESDRLQFRGPVLPLGDNRVVPETVKALREQRDMFET